MVKLSHDHCLLVRRSSAENVHMPDVLSAVIHLKYFVKLVSTYAKKVLFGEFSQFLHAARLGVELAIDIVPFDVLSGNYAMDKQRFSVGLGSEVQLMSDESSRQLVISSDHLDLVAGLGELFNNFFSVELKRAFGNDEAAEHELRFRFLS